ncbi:MULTISPECIES: hypothetical protein [Extibacter]|uniref:YkvI family membrane protein n=1 Tax=Extibacter TaxID=1918452 RepID=UPI001AA14376|nr:MULTISPECIES: hypothetical protein [Extibacter]BDF32547.1 membrane protein [Lachnospiraceae bacterium]MBO1719385.1 hypothetical protein [Extibacter sp. GGCC_0201]MCB6203563.1 hypothetical protein [Extibacter muris]MCQ4665056.1 hypothetical protein [Extibacter muris]MCQ4694422.1 hypothetical protein [Extibacter muris]
MEENKAKIGQVIAIGGAFMGFVIGSSFASGQECMQYFTGFGVAGSVGAGAIALVLYAWFVSTIVEDGRYLKLNNSGKMFNFYLGKYLGFALEWFTPIMLFFVYSMMISGAGSTFEEYYGVNGNIGRAIMIIASLGTVLLGLEKLVKIVGYIAPVLLVVTMFIGILSIVNNPEGIAQADQNLKTVQVNTNFNNWALSGLMYGAYTVTGVVPYLADIGKSTATNKKNSILGGLFGGGAFLIAVMILNFGLLANITDVYNLEIPSLFVAASISPVFGHIFSVLLLLGIYTTAVPMLYTVCNKISSDAKSKAYRVAAIVTAIVSIFGGQLSFSTMISIIYPISGYAGVVIFAGMIYTKYIKKKKYEEFDEEDVLIKKM